MSLPEIIFTILISCVSALGCLWAFSKRGKPALKAPISAKHDPISYLFKDGYLEHASVAGLALLGRSLQQSDWADMRLALMTRFDGIPLTLPTKAHQPILLDASSNQDSATLSICWIDEALHVKLDEAQSASPEAMHSLATMQAMKVEYELLRQAYETAPFPVWFVDRSRLVKWHNNAYKSLFKSVFDAPIDPSKPLFAELLDITEIPQQHRMSLVRHGDDAVLWFGVSRADIDDGHMFHASDINAVITAEIAQRNFVQTLAKTFAQLSIGLAIFDRNRLLALFNPALVNLTALPADFLSARPDLSTFFDRLRDNRVMPEPKNYHSWRQQIAEVISAASNGRYQETWTLDTGQTYRVTGRPHPDGAIAFLIEDISAETLVTRNFRHELEINQSLINALEDGLAVFSSAGILQFSNAAYGKIWNLDLENSFAQVTILDSIHEWKRHCNAEKPWDDLHEFVMKVGTRSAWSLEIQCPQKNAVICHVVPIASGSTLVRFEMVKQATEKTIEVLPS